MRHHSTETETQIFVGWMLAIFLVLYGCTAKTPAKPATIPAQSNMTPQVKEQSELSQSAGQSESALATLKRGELPATPDSSKSSVSVFADRRPQGNFYRIKQLQL